MQETRQDGDSDDPALSTSHSNDAMSNKRQRNIKLVQDIVSRYVNQMLHGCGDTACKQLLCDNGRQNATGPPVRRYTPRSARTIALTLASGPRPRSRLCAQKPDSSTSARPVVHEGPRDPSDLTQQLADMESIKRLCEPEHAVASTANRPRDLASPLTGHAIVIRKLHAILDNIEEPLLTFLRFQGLTVDDIRTIARLILTNIRTLLMTFPPPEDGRAENCDGIYLVDAVIQTGKASLGVTPSRDVPILHQCMDVFDYMDNAQNLGLLRRYLSYIAKMSDAQYKAGAPSAETGSNLVNALCDSIAMWAHADLTHRQSYALVVWLKHTFLQHWDGSPLLPFDTISLACLRLLAALEAHDASRSDQLKSLYAMNIVAALVDDEGTAQTWLEASTSDNGRLVHLLEFSFLSTKKRRAVYFRTANHLRMQHAHGNAEKTNALRSRTTRDGYDPDAGSQLACLEDHYLLLSVGRMTLLRDSLNQVWQRRSSELLRPLRVRLGEMDTFEVGQDLGGVQIEFFNLVCKEIFSEQLGMFTSDSKTGLSYFKPGCLQPLYMFELFGLLFGLAVYNGITLPVSFPLVFYRKLLGLPCDDLVCIRDGWPTMYKSLGDILAEDIPGLEQVFALEANGIRLSVSSFGQGPERETPKITARVVEATPIVHHDEMLDSKAAISSLTPSSTPSSATTIDPQTLAWPGYSFEPASEHEPLDVTTANKANYVKDYVHWLTSASVAAQLHSFLTGFHRIVPRPHLRLFSPTHLQSLIEGTPHISIPDLRAATHYEGYSPTSSYINSFWTIVESWPEAKQIQLLKFVTAAERVPAGGAGNVMFRIARAEHIGAEAEQWLPTSSTCFGTLVLPRYENGTVLEQKLTVALEMGGEGFGTG